MNGKQYVPDGHAPGLHPCAVEQVSSNFSIVVAQKKLSEPVETGELLSSNTGDSVDSTRADEGLSVFSATNKTKEGTGVGSELTSSIGASPHSLSPQQYVPAGQSGSPSLHVIAEAHVAARSSRFFAQ
jgi:hypothetical protein